MKKKLWAVLLAITCTVLLMMGCQKQDESVSDRKETTQNGTLQDGTMQEEKAEEGKQIDQLTSYTYGQKQGNGR